MQPVTRFHRTLGAHAISLALFGAAVPAVAETARDFAGRYEAEAKTASAAYVASAARGAEFFKARHGQEWSCSSCHTNNPAADGKHATTAKPIAPLAPAANAERFTRADKVDKWFKRNCKDVLARECTAAEKGDVLAYLIAVGK